MASGCLPPPHAPVTGCFPSHRLVAALLVVLRVTVTALLVSDHGSCWSRQLLVTALLVTALLVVLRVTVTALPVTALLVTALLISDHGSCWSRRCWSRQLLVTALLVTAQAVGAILHTPAAASDGCARSYGVYTTLRRPVVRPERRGGAAA
jgi:hypothetical protein